MPAELDDLCDAGCPDRVPAAEHIAVDDTAMTTGADVSFLSPARVGDVLVATARLRARSGRSLLIDVAVGTRGDDGGDGRDGRVAELRARARTRAASPGVAPVRD